MRRFYASQPLPPEQAAALLATREQALDQMIRGSVLVAFVAVVGFAATAFWSGEWGSAIIFAALFGVLVGMALAKRLSLRVRGGIFVSLLYLVGIVSLYTLGVGGASRVFFLSFAVLTTAIFGLGQGVVAGGLGLITWAVFGLLGSLGVWAPSAPPQSALAVDWFSAAASMTLCAVALMIAVRQFLQVRATAVATAQEVADLAAAQIRLAEQTRALELASNEAQTANRQLEAESASHRRRAALLALNAEVAHAAAGQHDQAELLTTVVQLISERFSFYHAGLFLLDDARAWAVLRAASSEGGQRMLARGHRLRTGQEGIVGYVTSTGQPRVALDVGADAVHFANPDLPATRSEMAVPIRVQGEVIGALDVQSAEPNAFTQEDAAVLQSLADQVGVAIDNARLFQETQRRLAELQALQQEARRATGAARDAGPRAFRYDGVDVVPLPGAAGTVPEAAPGALRLPLRFGDQALGTLELHRGDEGFTPEDQELAAAVAERMALALESAQVFESTRARAQQLIGLSEVSLKLTGPQLAAEQAVEQIVDGAQRLFEADGAGLWLPVADDELELVVSRHLGLAGQRARRGEDLAGQVLAAGRPQRVDDYAAWSGRTGSAAAPFHAALAVPIHWQNQVRGVLALTHASPSRRFTPDDEQIAQLYAAQAAATLENARLFGETQRRLRELARINDLSRALTSQFDLTSLVGLVGEKLFEMFSCANGFVALYDSRTNLIEFPFFMEAGQRLAVPANPLGQGVTSIVIQTRQPLRIVRDAERQLEQLGAITTGRPARSWLGAPILAGDDVIGALSLQDLEAEDVFTEADERLLSTVAANVGVAIQNARLFAQTQQRAEELGALNRLGQDLAAQLDVNALAELVVERVRQTFNVDNAYLALYHEATGLIDIPVLYDGGERVRLEPFALGRGLTSIIIESRRPLLINEQAEARVAELGGILTGRPPRSFLGVPVLAGQQVLGVLSVQDLETEGRFDDEQARLLSTIAASVGVALQNARLFAQTEERAAELAVINQLARSISEQLEPVQVLQTVYAQIQQVIALDGFFVTLYDPVHDLQSTPVMYESGVRHEEAPRALPARGLIRQVIETGELVHIQRTPEEVERITLSPEQALSQFTRVPASLVYVPLQFGARVGGVMAVQSFTFNAYTERHLEVLQAIANHVVVALQNARLFEETQHRAEQLATAADIARATTSVTDPDALIVRAVELIRDRFERSTGTNYAALFLIDETGRWARLRHATGQAGRVLLERKHQLEVGGNSMVGWTAANRKARIALDVGAEPVRFANPLLPHTRSELALPLIAGDTVIGALDVQSTKSGAFAEADVAVLQTMADQIAIALRNAQLLADTRRAQAFLDSVIESLPVVLSVKQAEDLRLVRWNRAGEDLLDLKRAELLGKTDAERLSPEEAEARENRERSVLAGAEMIDIPEEPVDTHQGRRYLHTRQVPILDEAGQPQWLLSISEDITDRKAAEAAIQTAQQAAVRRAQLLAAATEVGRAATASLDRAAMLATTVELIRERFGFYHAAVFVVEPGSGVAELAEATGEAGRQLKARQHQLAVGSRSLVGTATATRRPVIVQDVTAEPGYFENPLLPGTRAEAVLPLLSGDQLVGALDVQSTTAGAFGDEEVSILTILADQLAVALQNVRLYEQAARQARRERLVVDITNKIRAASDMDSMLRVAVSELRTALGARHAAVRLAPGAPASAPRGNGGNGAAGEGNGGGG